MEHLDKELAGANILLDRGLKKALVHHVGHDRNRHQQNPFGNSFGFIHFADDVVERLTFFLKIARSRAEDSQQLVRPRFE